MLFKSNHNDGYGLRMWEGLLSVGEICAFSRAITNLPADWKEQIDSGLPELIWIHSNSCGDRTIYTEHPPLAEVEEFFGTILGYYPDVVEVYTATSTSGNGYFCAHKSMHHPDKFACVFIQSAEGSNYFNYLNKLKKEE